MTTPDELYQLLPAVYRTRDAARGESLKALISVLAEQAGVVEADIARLYENWFIETCDEWVVPYFGDLLGVRGLHSVSDATFSLRARVANTLAYRRRKGTATMLEQLAHDTTGWPAYAVEFFERLGTTQNYNHLRPHNVVTADLRRTDLLDLLGSPFDKIPRTVEVRQISNGRGKHNIPNVGLFLWRLQAYPMAGVTACTVSAAAGRYTFSPLGNDAPLFNSPDPETEITHLAEEINVPEALRRRALYDELEERRQALTDGQPVRATFFDQSPVLKVFVQTAAGLPLVELLPEEITICNLEDWHQPQPTKAYNKRPKLPPQPGDPSDRIFQIKAAVDPLLGRLTFPIGLAPHRVIVDFAYGFSGDVGGGPYERTASVNSQMDRKITWHAGVSQTLAPVPNKIFATVREAVDAWNLQPANTVGQIAILDSRTYEENLTGTHAIKVPEGSRLLILAGELPAGGTLESVLAQEQRAHLCGNISVSGTAPAKSDVPGELLLNGLLIEGDMKVLTGHLGRLRIEHSTIVPGKGKLSVNGANDELIVQVERSICGALDLPASVKQIMVKESIVDGDGSNALTAPGALANLQASTFFGEVSARMLEAGNSIFMEKVSAVLRQAGCVRFCFLPEESVTPRRYRCQPELVLAEVKDPALEKQIRSWIKPAFTSTNYGQPGYAQLKLSVPDEIRTGADNGSEMGVFRFLLQPQREANLRASLDEYLRFGLEAGIFYRT